MLPIGYNRSIFIVLICCLSHILLSSEILQMSLPKRKKNRLKCFPSSTDRQVHPDIYNYLLVLLPCSPSPTPTPQKTQICFSRTLSLFYFFLQGKFLYIH